MNKDVFVLSSDNQGKIKEFNTMLNEIGINIISKSQVSEEAKMLNVIEDQDTLQGNALKKTRELFDTLNGKYNVISDDTGLFVDKLDGKPGIYAARMFKNIKSKECINDNQKLIKILNDKLIENNEDINDLENRRAYFKMVLALKTVDGKEYIFEGVSKGFITLKEKGENGFAYDKIFIPEEYKKEKLTYADLKPETKNQISHRHRSIMKFKKFYKNKGLKWGIYDAQLKGVKANYVADSFDESIIQIKQRIERLEETKLTTIEDIYDAANFYGYYPIKISQKEAYTIENSNDVGLLTVVKGIEVSKSRAQEAMFALIKQ